MMRLSTSPALFFLGLCFFIFTPKPLAAAEYRVDPVASQLSFSGVHAGTEFTGVFEEWKADIRFDPADLPGSAIRAEIDLASAKTGNKLYDGTLPEKDWFSVEIHPKAVFESLAFEKTGEGIYKVDGVLTIRGIEKPLSFEFSLSDLSAPPVDVQASFAIARLDYDIGRESDPDGEWVSKEIQMSLDIKAVPEERAP